MTEKQGKFNRSSLDLDVSKETDRLVAMLQETVFRKMRRQGAVVGISGGIDSSVVLALCSRAFEPQRVLGLMMPENESNPESAHLAKVLADCFGVETLTEDISSVLNSFGCYQRRDEAIQRVFPDYVPGWSAKIVLPGNLLEQKTLNFFRLVVSNPQGEQFSQRLPLNEYYQIVAASNFKQRVRMTILYYQAELRNYAVIGTANKNEHDLGFFVKYGDGGADLQPIAHLFKTQVYQLARFLGVPEEIQRRIPTTDTYPGGSTQEEFFYRVPFDLLDTIWFGYERGRTNEQIASALGLTIDQVDRVVRDIESKKRATEYLRLAPVMV